MSSYTVELVGGREDGQVIRVPSEIVDVGVLDMFEMAAGSLIADPTVSAATEVPTRRVRYRITGAVNARGCLRAVIERE